MEFEYRVLGTPQQNGGVEQKFATLFNRYMPCPMVGNSLLFQEMAYGLKPPTLPCFSEIISSLQIDIWKPISTFFWEGKEKHPGFGAKIWQNVYQRQHPS